MEVDGGPLVGPGGAGDHRGVIEGRAVGIESIKALAEVGHGGGVGGPGQVVGVGDRGKHSVQLGSDQRGVVGGRGRDV